MMKTTHQPKLKVGQQVTIYRDPYTKQEPEGEAILKRLDQYHGDEVEYWWVRFDGDDQDVYRRIVP